MTKGVSVLATLWCIAGASAVAQVQATDTLNLHHEDNADFTFTESQLDEGLDAAQTVVSVTAKNDPFLNNVGFRFSPMRYRVRALDNMYNQTYMNGLRMNDTESGRFNYGSIGGLNDATRNKEGVDAYDYNTFGSVRQGGGQSINSRASQFAQGRKLSLSATNRNYYGRVMYTHATGLLSNGWAFAGSVGYRGAKEGVIDGTFYNSASYFLAAEKRLGDNHALSLVTYGSPTERAQQGASTEEAYWLANSHYYNPYWGYQNGEKRNSRVVETFSPTTILTWDWTSKDRKSKLTTNLGFAYNQYSSTALGWNGNAYDPRPDYYKNLPSGVGDVWDKNSAHYVGKESFLLDQWQTLYDAWTGSEANRQVNWDRMYFVNRENEANGGEALYYQERRHNDQLVGAFSTTLNHSFNKNHKIAVGLNYNRTHGMHYKTMADLLGGTRYTDIDKFAVNEHGANSKEAQNDLRNPNRQIGKDDRFGYDYNIDVNKADIWSNYQYTGGYGQVILAGHIDGTTMERDGKMENGRYQNNSYGKSGVAKFLGGGGNVTLAFTPTRNHRLALSVGMSSEAPLARNAFVAPRVQNNFVNNLTNEDQMSFDLSYAFRFGPVVGKVSGYHTQFSNMIEQTAYYNDQQSTFVYLTMNGIDRAHYGVEAALEVHATSNLTFLLMGSVGDALYTSNPYAQVSYEGMNSDELKKLNTVLNPVTKQEMPMQVIAKGMRASSTPLTALSAGAKYNIRGWFFEASANYYDRVYVGFSPYRRLNSTYATDGQFYLPTGVGPTGMAAFDPSLAELKENGGILFSNEGHAMAQYAAEQEKFKGGFMFDASIGRYIRLRGGKSLSINLSFQNIGNNTNLRTGGFEQNRSNSYYKESGGSYSKGESRAYKFSKNSKYYYANAFNFFLNIGYKF